MTQQQSQTQSGTDLISGTLLRRPNRFLAEVRVDGRDALAHVPNSGRMTELMVHGAEVLLRPAPKDTGRKTAYDLLLVRYAGRWVGVDARMPPSLVVDAWQAGLLPSFAGYDRVRREVRFGESRLDLLFEGATPTPPLYVEAKSVNLVEDGTGLFPDAPTERGARHLRELATAVAQGFRGAVAFVVQRDDVQRVMPYVEADPAFAEALRAAVDAGVEAYAIACSVSPDGADDRVTRPVRLVPVELPETTP